MSSAERSRADASPRMTRVATMIAGIAALLAVSAGATRAQQPASAAPDSAWLVASAVLTLPEPLRAGAEVRTWRPGDHLAVLRAGTNDLVCLADRTDEDGFAAACYHASLEPFMERGRELRRQGIDGARRDETRWAEIEAGTLPMPAMAMVYNLRFPTAEFDPDTTDAATGYRLHALYIRDATGESTGLPIQPGDGPWLMLAGTPSAHVMIALPPKTQP